MQGVTLGDNTISLWMKWPGSRAVDEGFWVLLLLSSKLKGSRPNPQAYPHECNREAAGYWLSWAGGAPGGQVHVPVNVTARPLIGGCPGLVEPLEAGLPEGWCISPQT